MKKQEKFDGEAGFISRVADWFGTPANDEAEISSEMDEGGEDWVLGADGWVHSPIQGNDSGLQPPRVSL